MKEFALALTLATQIALGEKPQDPSPKHQSPDLVSQIQNSARCTIDLSEPNPNISPIHHSTLNPNDSKLLKSLGENIAESIENKHNSIPDTRKCNGGKDVSLSFNFNEAIVIQGKLTKSFDVTVFYGKDSAITGIKVRLIPVIDPKFGISPAQETGLYVNINLLRNTFFASPMVGDPLVSYIYKDDLVPILKRISKAIGVVPKRG